MSLGMTLDQLVSPARYRPYEELWKSHAPPGERLQEYMRKEWNDEPHEGETPPDVVEAVLLYSADAVEAIEAAAPLAAGDILFRIDPEPFEIAVRQREAQVRRFEADLRLAQVNVDRAETLLEVQAAAQLDLDTWNAKRDIATAAIAEAQAALDNARWQLAETEVTAPYDGYVVNLQLRPGNVVTMVPAASPMAFVSDESNPVIASFSQSAVRKIAVGDEAEVVFTNIPGETFAGRVSRVIALGSEAQLNASGQLPSFTGEPVNDRWGVLVELEDREVARSIPQGAGGTVAVYTQAGKPVHVISKVALRMNAWLAYLTSP
jgi:multidrug resistance efflux pump